MSELGLWDSWDLRDKELEHIKTYKEIMYQVSPSMIIESFCKNLSETSHKSQFRHSGSDMAFRNICTNF